MSVGRFCGVGAALAATVAGALLGGGGVAEATFAGQNGLLAYSTNGNCDADAPEGGGCPGFYVEVVNPRQPKQRRAVSPKDATCCAGDPDWSPDGKRLLYDSEGDVFVTRRDRSLSRRLIRRAIEPAWSANGRRLVFARDLHPVGGGRDDRDLFVRSLRGGQARRITRGGGDSADWSSRGEIAFVRTDRRFRTDVYVVRPDGTGLRRLTRGNTGDQPSWSPDGRLLAIERRGSDDRLNIAVIDRQGRLKRTLTREGATDPVWSPDGSRIAFSRRSRRFPISLLYTVRARGGGLRRLLPRLLSVHDLDWQPRPRR